MGQVVNNVMLQKHPVTTYPLEIKIFYLHGLALMMNVDGEIHQLEKEYLISLIKALKMGDSLINELIEFAQNPEEKMLNEVIQGIKNHEDAKLYFMVDALILARKDGEIHENEAALTANYFDLFSISEEDRLKIKNVATIIHQKDKDLALTLYLSDQPFYDRFSYLFEFIGFDIQKMLKELYQFEWEKKTYTEDNRSSKNLVTTSPITNKQFALFLNSQLRQKQLTTQDNLQFSYENQIIFDTALSDLKYNTSKNIFLYEKKSQDQFITGISPNGMKYFIIWLNNLLKIQLKIVILKVKKPDSFRDFTAVFNYKRTIQNPPKKICCPLKNTRYLECIEGKFNADTSYQEVSDNQIIKNLTFRLMQAPKEDQ